jgi:hypothetical protein
MTERTCVEEGCTTILSRFNQSDRCALHDEPDFKVTLPTTEHVGPGVRHGDGLRAEAARRGMSLYEVRKEREAQGTGAPVKRGQSRQNPDVIVTAVRLPRDLHARATRIAAERDISVNWLVVKGLELKLANLPELP